MSDIQNQPSNLTDGMHVVVEALLRNGFDTIYGVVGIPVTDLARHAQERGIRYIGFRHEQSAGNAAAITGFLTGKPGICLTVSAPGFLNGLTALATATVNGFPMIQISGSSDRAIIDLQQGDYEGLDQMNVAKTFAKASYRINRPEDIGIGLARAIRAAVSGRPGGVYLDLTTALLGSVIDQAEVEKTLFTVLDPAPKMIPDRQAVDRALDLLSKARKPLVIIGKGAAYAQAEKSIREFLEQTGIPFLPMSMAKGVMPDDHPLSAAAARGLVLKNADVVMLLGARLNWLLAHGKGQKWNPDARFIQLDIEPEEIDSNRPIAAPVVGDIASSMEALLAGLTAYPMTQQNDWLEEIDRVKQVNAAKMEAKLNANPSPMNFFSALKAIRTMLEKHREVYLVNEGANTLDDTRNVINMYSPRKRLDCGTWGVMGVGMGYAIGAAVYQLPVTIVILNNGGIYNGSHANLGGGTDPSPTTLDAQARYDRLITAFGGTPYYATTPEELEKALEAGIASKKPTLIDCAIDPKAGLESGHIGNLNPKVVGK